MHSDHDYAPSRLKSPETCVLPLANGTFDLDGDRFGIEADLSRVIADEGPGVYEVNIFGILNGDITLISEYTIFHDIPRPTRYGKP